MAKIRDREKIPIRESLDLPLFVVIQSQLWDLIVVRRLLNPICQADQALEELQVRRGHPQSVKTLLLTGAESSLPINRRLETKEERSLINDDMDGRSSQERIKYKKRRCPGRLD